MSTLHVFLDYSGDLTFGRGSACVCTLGMAWSWAPDSLSEPLSKLRFGLLKAEGVAYSRFHASKDDAWVTNDVLNCLSASPHYRWTGLVVDKASVPSRFQPKSKFLGALYPTVVRFLLKRRWNLPTTLVVVCDWEESRGGVVRLMVTRAIEAECKSRLQPRTNLKVGFMHSAGNAGLQVADHCAWTLFRKHRQPNPTPKQLAPYRALGSRMAAPEWVLPPWYWNTV